MDLSLSEEQRLLGEAADRFIAGRYTFEARRAILQSSEGFSREIWREFADLGWLGLSIPEEYGGLGASAVETGIVMEALGRALVVEPYLATAVISARLIAALGSEEQKSELLPTDCRGQVAARVRPCRAAGALCARRCRDHGRRARTRAGISPGARTSCSARPGRTHCWSPRVSPATSESGRASACSRCRASSEGLTITAYQTLDGGRAGNIELVEVAVPAGALLGDNDGCAARDREGGGLRHRGDGFGGDRLHAGAARDDHCLHQTAHPVRQAAGGQSGAAPSHGVDGRQDRGGARERAQCRADGRCRSG